MSELKFNVSSTWRQAAVRGRQCTVLTDNVSGTGNKASFRRVSCGLHHHGGLQYSKHGAVLYEEFGDANVSNAYNKETFVMLLFLFVPFLLSFLYLDLYFYHEFNQD